MHVFCGHNVRKKARGYCTLKLIPTLIGMLSIFFVGMYYVFFETLTCNVCFYLKFCTL